jgi:L-ascorbate metabolism protein UlaG (beta-lactamase superfamily)
MEIKHLGHSSFRIKGKQASVVTDPFNIQYTGLPFAKVTADIITVSHEHKDHNAVENVEGEPVVVRGPGEYEIKGVRIYGYKSFHDNTNGSERGVNTLYLIVMEGIRILHCGDLGHTMSEDLLGEIGDVDVLLIPTGGTYTVSAKEASTIVKKVEPLIVVPMHYKVSGNAEKYANLQDLDAFVKEIDKEPNRVEKLVLTRETTPTELEVAVLGKIG